MDESLKSLSSGQGEKFYAELGRLTGKTVENLKNIDLCQLPWEQIGTALKFGLGAAESITGVSGLGIIGEFLRYCLPACCAGQPESEEERFDRIVRETLKEEAEIKAKEAEQEAEKSRKAAEKQRTNETQAFMIFNHTPMLLK